MKVFMMLADHAQTVNGKLYILGGGWSVTGPDPVPSSVAIRIEVPWNEANRKHNLKVELLDADFKPLKIPSPTGVAPVIVTGDFEVGRPPGLIAGTPIDFPFAFNVGPLPLPPGQRFVWKLSIDDKSNDNWQVAFSTRAGHR